MAITTLGLTGFEHGFIAAAATAGGGLFDTLTAGCTANTTSPRNGSYCARMTAAASAQRMTNTMSPSQTKIVERVAVRVVSRPPSGTYDLVTAYDGVTSAFFIRVSSAGVLTALLTGGTAQTGPTIDTTNWHLIELQVDTAAKTLDWKVDGVLQTRATTVSTLNAVGAATLGQPTSGTVTVDFDDVIIGTWTNAATDWYGNGKVLAQRAGVDGTHATITSLSPGDAGTAYSGTPTTVNTMVDDPPGTLGWTATRSTTDNIALRTATVGAYAEIKPATTSETGTANSVKAVLSYSSVTATANLAACDIRNTANVVTPIWGTTGGTGADFSESTNFFKSAIVTAPAGGWTAAEINALRWRFGGCTSVDVSPIPTVQALMLEVDWPIVVPTATPVARISLASAPEPLTRTNHSINVRARKTSGTGTVTLSVALYEGASNRSGDLATSALTTSLADYALAVPDVSAANITSYADLELRVWANSPSGDAVAVEVANLKLSAPAGGGPTTHQLGGTTIGTGGTSGNVTVAHPLAATSTGASVTTGNARVAAPLAGTTAAGSTTAGNAKVTVGLAGTTAGASTTAGGNRAAWALAGTSTGTAATSGDARVTVGIAGTTTGSSATTGEIATLGVEHALAGTSTGSSGTTGAGTVAHPLAGTSTGTSGTTGNVTVGHPLAATSTGTSVTTGAPTVAHPLAATSTGASASTGDVRVTVTVAGTTTGTATTVGDAKVAVGLAGTTNGSATTAGEARVAIPLAGTSAGSSITSAGFAGSVGLFGTSTGTSATAGELRAAVPFTGTSTGTSTSAGDLRVSQPLTGTTAGTATTAGDARIAAAVGGQSEGSASTTGLLAVTSQFTLGGTSTGTSGSTGNLRVAVTLAATTTGTAATSGDARATFRVAGTTSGFSGTGGSLETYVVITALAGTTAGTSGTTGNARLVAALAATTTGGGATAGTATASYRLVAVTAGVSGTGGSLFVQGWILEVARLEGTGATITRDGNGSATVLTGAGQATAVESTGGALALVD